MSLQLQMHPSPYLQQPREKHAVGAFPMWPELAGLLQAQVAAAPQQLGDHVVGLGLCPGADRVQHRPAGPDGLGGRLQQGELEVDQPGDVAGAVAPARLGTAAQAAQVGAGRVDQDGVGAVAPGLGT